VKATTEQLVSALRVLSVEMHSEDGVANAVVAEAADRLTLMANLVAKHVQETKEDVEQMAVASETMVEATAKIQSLRERIKRLEEAGDKMEAWLRDERLDAVQHTVSKWRKAKEAKP
jgi:uncharacterized protein Yka (UPF0111/DUF47 family)